MKTCVVIPIPLDSPDVYTLFKPFIQRFCDTWRQFPPGEDCELIAVTNNDLVTSELETMFEGLNPTWLAYSGAGADIGSFQLAAKERPGCFMVFCVSRVYFHRANWLARLVERHRYHGPGLYGTSASYEGGKLHVCTRCYAMDADLVNEYPVKIASRDQGTFWEVGQNNPHGCLSDWVESKGLPAFVLYWDGCYKKHKWLLPGNIFRRGDQSNMLVFDKHTYLWANASPEEKARLTKLMEEI